MCTTDRKIHILKSEQIGKLKTFWFKKNVSKSFGFKSTDKKKLFFNPKRVYKRNLEWAAAGVAMSSGDREGSPYKP